MKNILLKLTSVLVLLFASLYGYSQSVVTNTIRYNPGTYAVMPPDLYVDIDFFDANGNKILEANEKGEIKLVISNKGGFANDVTVKIIPEKNYKGLSFGKSEFITSIDSNTESYLKIPVSADFNILTDSVKLNIDISEPFGYDIKAVMLLSTFEHQKAKLEMQGVSIVDAGAGLRALNNNPDGKLQKGEVVQAYITIQNTGQALAENIEYTITSSDPNVFLPFGANFANKEIKGTLKNLKIGEFAEISVRLSPNNNYEHKGAYLPVYITVSEHFSKGDIISKNIPIPLDEVPQKPTVLTIDANIDKLLAMRKTEIFSTSDRISSKMIRDISIAPVGEPLFVDAVAIVIGAEENGYDVAPAPYAARDAEIMSKYFKTTMGVNDVRTYTNKDVTKTKLEDIFDATRGELVNSVTKGETDVFIFYSGHGMPDVDEDGKVDVYLFPYDARKDMLKERGYSLNKLYTNLNSLEAKSVTVILDACFSGSSRQSSSYAGVSIGNTKGIEIKARDMGVRPWETNPNFRLFTSSSSDQTSLGFDQSQSGLFTYYLATGLQGDADTNKDGEVTLKELSEFVSENVSKTAKQIRNGDQSPQLFGNTDLVLGKIK